MNDDNKTLSVVEKTNVHPSRTFEDMPEKERTLAEEMGLDLTLNVDERLSQVIYKTNDALRLAVEAGLYLTSIKAECIHGEFGKYLEKVGISRQRAAEMMKLSQITAALPTAERKKVLSLTKKKALLLANTDPDIIHDALDDELGDIKELSYDHLKRRIKDLEDDKANLETQLDTAEVQKDELKARLNQQQVADQPDFYTTIRHESDAVSQKAMLCIDDLNTHLGDLLELPELDGKARPYFDMAAASVLIHLNGLQAKISQILSMANNSFPTEITTAQINAAILYSDSEIEHAIEDHAMLTREHEQEKQIRENQRAANKPRGRGRPRKDAEV